MEFLIGGVAVFFVLLALGAPIYISLLCGAMLVMIFGLGMPSHMVIQTMVAKIDVFAFMAIAPFILAGNMMSKGGASRAMVNLVEPFVGRFPGGLAIVAVLSCSLFAAMSGSTLATSAAMGAILVGPMTEKGYPKGFVAALLACAGTLGIMIPPSINLIIYGGLTEQSVPILFMAGPIVGIMLAAMLCGTVVLLCRGKEYAIGRRFTWGERWRASLKGLPSILMFFIIMVPIYSGLCTPTEAASISCVYAFLIGRFVYRELNWKKAWEATKDAARTTAIILIIITCGMTFGSGLIAFGLPTLITNFLITHGVVSWQFLLLCILIWVALGFVMESTTVMVILVPLIVEVFPVLGISPIHFGIITVLCTEIALITPPIGANLYVMSSVSGVSIDEIVRKIWPFVVVMFIGLIVVTFWEGLPLWLPRVLGMLN